MEKWSSLIFLLVVADAMIPLNVCLMCHIEEEWRRHIGTTLIHLPKRHTVFPAFVVGGKNAIISLGGRVAWAYIGKVENTMVW